MGSCLEKIGRDVANKCKGLPLAAKVLGGLFRSNPNFEDILKDAMWDSSNNEIIPVLRVSYYYLPPYLKQCFAYCSLFPEDYRFEKTELVLMWMAEGLLEPSKGNSTLEEVGYRYIDDLTSRSFFQPLPKKVHIDYMDRKTINDYFIMHDLIHELATDVARDFYFRLGESGDKIGNKTRHLSCNSKNYSCLDNEVFQKLKGVRTFIGLNFSYIPKSIGNAFSHITLSNMNYLRTLSLEDLSALEIVPESIEKFIHLRYLNLSGTSIARLPNSICKLYNLQTLKLRSCHYLEMLPSDMRDLVNLRHLDISGTRLKEMPRGLGNLKDLQFLSDFIVGEEQETGIGELGIISHLKGCIEIRKLENVKSGNEAYIVRLMEKKHIKDLTLSWSKDGDVEGSTTERDILSNLQPHWDLEALRIECYRGTIFPDWLGSPSYHNITRLQLDDCVNCFKLPPLGWLPALKELKIWGLESIESIGDEFLKGNSCASMIPFPSLEILWFRSMTAWEQWHSTDKEAFPKLRQLIISYCGKLVGILPCQLLSLETLEIKDCPLLYYIPRCHKLQNLMTYESVNVVWQEYELPPSLCNLQISGCRMLESMLEALSKHSHLQKLSISNCFNVSTPMIHLPPSLQHLNIRRCEKVDFVLSSTPLQNLQSISIEKCNFVKFTSDDMEGLLPNLRKLRIYICSQMESFPEGILVPSLRELHIQFCDKLLSHHAKWQLPSNIAYLSIYHPCSRDVKCFPEGSSLPTSLTTLELDGFGCLETLNCSGLQHLTSLQQLKIMQCFALEKLSGEKLPASLRKLSIWRCSLLEEKYHNRDEQLFRQISHIPHIDIPTGLLSQGLESKRFSPLLISVPLGI